MSIVTTKKSNRNSYLTFLNTYPNSTGTNLDLNATSGVSIADYTGTYWRPTDSSGYTSKATVDNGNIELGFNVKWGELNTNSGKIPVTVSLMLSEYQYWLNVTNNPSTVSSSTLILGYDYSFAVNDNTYNPNVPIVEVKNNNNNLPDFTTESGTAYTFKASNYGTYVRSHSTMLWSKTFDVVPKNGKASIDVSVNHLYLHWRDIYNGRRPTIWLGKVNKTFNYSGTLFTNSVSINPSTVNITLVPNKVTVTPYTPGGETTYRNFIVNSVSDRTVINNIKTTVNSYRDSVSNHKLTAKNNTVNTTFGTTAWSSENPSVIKVSPSTGTNTIATFNGTFTNNCKVTFSSTAGDTVASANTVFTFNRNNSYSFKCNNTNLATVNSSTGQITAKSGRNGSYVITTTFTGGLTHNTIFNSYLRPTSISNFTAINKSGSNVITVNRGESVTLRAMVLPYNKSNAMTSAYTGYRPIAFSVNNSKLGSVTTSKASSTLPYYEATYTAPGGYSTNDVNVTLSATTSNITTTPANIVLKIKKNDSVLPNLVLRCSKTSPNPVKVNNYALVTYEVVPAEGERALTADEKKYLNNISITKLNTTYSSDSLTVQANVVTNTTEIEQAGIKVTNAKRQIVYKITATNTNNLQGSTWQSEATFNYNSNTSETGTAKTISSTDNHTVTFNYLTLTPNKIIAYKGQRFTLDLDFDCTAATTINVSASSNLTEISKVINYNGDNKSGDGTLIYTTNELGESTITAESTADTLYDTCKIYTVDKLTSNIIYPHIISSNQFNNDGLFHNYYTQLRYKDNELLRIVFKMPPSYVYSGLANIKVKVNYREYIHTSNPDTEEVTVTLANVASEQQYSLNDNPELFSVNYPLTDTNDITDVLEIYEMMYNDSPYCIFQENPDMRSSNSAIESFELIFEGIPGIFPDLTNMDNVSPNTSYPDTDKRYSNNVSTIVYTVPDYTKLLPEFDVDKYSEYSKTVDNKYDLEDMVVNSLIDSKSPYVNYYVLAYQSTVLGYVENLTDIVNDYGKDICSLTTFGKTGDPISVYPFYKFLLSQNYIKSIDRYLVSRYLDVANFVKETGLTTIQLPDAFYPSYTRNMFMNRDMIYTTYAEQLDLDNNILSLATNPDYVLYNIRDNLPTFSNTSSTDNYTYPIASDDTNEYFHNDEQRPNEYKSTDWFNTHTISPLKEFTNGLPFIKYGLTSEYEFNTISFDYNETHLPHMDDVQAIYIPSTLNTSNSSWNNYLTNTDIANIQLTKGNTNSTANPDVIVLNNEVKFGTTNSPYGIMTLPSYNYTNYTIYIAARVDNAATTDNHITFLSCLYRIPTMTNVQTNMDCGFSLANYDTVTYSLSQQGPIPTYNVNTLTDALNKIHLTNSFTTANESISGTIKTYRVYTLSVQSDVAKLYITKPNGKCNYWKTLSFTPTINSTHNNKFNINSDYSIALMSKSNMVSNAATYYKYIAVATTVHSEAAIKYNSECIARNIF